MSLADIAQRLEKIDRKTREIVIASANNGESFSDYTDQLKALMDEVAELKQTRSKIENQRNSDAFAFSRISSAVKALEGMTEEMKQWDETLIRQLVDTVKVVSSDEIIVYLHGGMKYGRISYIKYKGGYTWILKTAKLLWIGTKVLYPHQPHRKEISLLNSSAKQ